MKKLFIFISLSMLLAACSNPFSSQKLSVSRENTKPQNTSCSDIQLDQSEVTAKQLRAVIHCLNQNNELKEIEDWTHTVSDQELKPWLSQYNSVLNSEPNFLYALKEMYLKEKDSGSLQHFLTKLLSKLTNDVEKQNLVQLIKEHSLWIQKFATNPRYRINTSNLALLSDVHSFQRGLNEQFKNSNLKILLKSIENYRSKNGSLSFQEIFKYFSTAGSISISTEDSAKGVSGFLNWLLENKRLETFSVAAEILMNKPIQCFNGGQTVADSLDTLINQLQNLPPKDLPEFLQKTLGATLLAGQNYCQIPKEVTSAAKLLMNSTAQGNLVGFFAFIQPLLKDKKFVTLLASKAFRELANELGKLNDTHLFQDIITLINWSNLNPVLEMNTAELMDSIFDEFSAEELWSLINLVPEDAQFFSTLNRMIEALPKLQRTKSISLQGDWLAPIAKDSFISVISLFSRMNDERKIIPIVDRVIELFKTMLDRGRTSYRAEQTLKPIHSLGTNSQAWKLGFWKNENSITSLSPSCTLLSLDINFFQITKELPVELFLENLETLSQCYGSNQSFLSLKSLAEYLVKKKSSGEIFNKFNSLQTGLMNFIFALNYEQAFHDFERVLKVSSSDLSQIHGALQAASSIINATLPSLHSAHETRKLVAKYVSQKNTYAALMQQLGYSEANVETATIAPQLLKKTLTALPQLFEEYCPSLNTELSDCDIDSDQVLLYRTSPEQLAVKIVSEYLSSSQTWIHPSEFKGWNTNPSSPKIISTLNYHLDPLLKQFDQKPGALHSVFGFLKRNQKSNYKLTTFLQERANSVHIMPYIYQIGDYPQTSKQFHQFVRIRILNDVDRLELLAVNADFMAFGKLKNFGMSFIKEIATSWGDVPVEQRPALATNETLAQARLSILKQFYIFNRGILQRVGSCDPRGRNRTGHWIQNRLCKGELSDVRARMFNLNLMLPLLDSPETLGLLRDLFYSIYENNSNEQRGVYIDGLKKVEFDQNIDLLEIIPKIARLGILHQAGISFLKNNASGTKAILSILNNTIPQKQDEVISKTLVTSDGQVFVRDLLKFAMSLEGKESDHIAILLHQLSHLENQDWLPFLLEITRRNPTLISIYSVSLHELLQKISPTELSADMLKLLSSVSSDLKNEQLINEISSILRDLPPAQTHFSKLIQLDLSLKIGDEWLKILANEKNQKQRDQMSTFFIGKDFDNLCDVFSDSNIVEKTYNFLEESNQNFGVLDLLKQCQLFLH